MGKESKGMMDPMESRQRYCIAFCCAAERTIIQLDKSDDEQALRAEIARLNAEHDGSWDGRSGTFQLFARSAS